MLIPSHLDLIANLNDFNNHAYNRFVEKIKDALDPNGILAPGKQGIWPNRFRHLREAQEYKGAASEKHSGQIGQLEQNGQS